MFTESPFRLPGTPHKRIVPSDSMKQVGAPVKVALP
jgi:hypothetical protein